MVNLPGLLTQVAFLLGSGSWLSVRHSCTQLYGSTLSASMGIISLGAAGLCDQAWSRGSTTIIIEDKEDNHLPLTLAVGHDTAATMVHLPVLLMQVSYLNHAYSVRTSDRCFIAMLCPPHIFDVTKKLLFLPALTYSSIVDLLLLVAGDVEQNPGPAIADLPRSLASVLETVRRIEEGQNAILRELQGVKKNQVATDLEIKSLNERVGTLEAAYSPVAPSETNASNVSDIINQLKSIMSRCEDTKN